MLQPARQWECEKFLGKTDNFIWTRQSKFVLRQNKLTTRSLRCWSSTTKAWIAIFNCFTEVSWPFHALLTQITDLVATLCIWLRFRTRLKLLTWAQTCSKRRYENIYPSGKASNWPSDENKYQYVDNCLERIRLAYIFVIFRYFTNCYSLIHRYAAYRMLVPNVMLLVFISSTTFIRVYFVGGRILEFCFGTEIPSYTV